MVDLRLKIEDEGLEAEINLANGQLVGLDSVEGKKFLHNGGSPEWDGEGWGCSEIVAFPVFGPVKDYKVRVGKRDFSLDQHGISRNTRDIPFEVRDSLINSVSLVQEYDGGKVKNQKFDPSKGNPRELSWLAYRLEKRFTLEGGTLYCEFTMTNNSKSDMLLYVCLASGVQ